MGKMFDTATYLYDTYIQCVCGDRCDFFKSNFFKKLVQQENIGIIFDSLFIEGKMNLENFDLVNKKDKALKLNVLNDGVDATLLLSPSIIQLKSEKKILIAIKTEAKMFPAPEILILTQLINGIEKDNKEYGSLIVTYATEHMSNFAPEVITTKLFDAKSDFVRQLISEDINEAKDEYLKCYEEKVVFESRKTHLTEQMQELVLEYNFNAAKKHLCEYIVGNNVKIKGDR
jgi:hypothetical protein